MEKWDTHTTLLAVLRALVFDINAVWTDLQALRESWRLKQVLDVDGALRPVVHWPIHQADREEQTSE
jgi:hypothetical protein